jgi:23S rRNA-/tRNA-specific pseudouridylate synthase
MRKYFITAVTDTRLEELLAQNLSPTDQPRIIIAAGGVWLGGKERLFDPQAWVEKGHTVRVYISPYQGESYSLETGQVIFEDQDLLAVYKPVNLNVHAVPSSLYYNLSYGVGRYLAGQGIDRQPAPVTRLDRPVQGIVLFGKSRAGERLLFSLVQQRKIRKWYLAALEKGAAIPWLRVDDHIGYDTGRTALQPTGKRAATWFKKREELDMADIYSAFPLTGRRHQIRFHAAHYLVPIIGDQIYGSGLALKSGEIALVCRGYNLPWRGKNLHIRLPQPFLDTFYRSLNRVSTVFSDPLPEID